MSATRHKNFRTKQAQTSHQLARTWRKHMFFDVFCRRGWTYRSSSCVEANPRCPATHWLRQQLPEFFWMSFVGMCLKQPISGAPVRVLPSCLQLFSTKKAVRCLLLWFFTQVATQTLGPLSTQEAKSINILFVSKGWVGGYALKIIFGCATTSIRWWIVLMQWMGKIQQRRLLGS